MAYGRMLRSIHSRSRAVAPAILGAGHCDCGPWCLSYRKPQDGQCGGPRLTTTVRVCTVRLRRRCRRLVPAEILNGPNPNPNLT